MADHLESDTSASPGCASFPGRRQQRHLTAIRVRDPRPLPAPTRSIAASSRPRRSTPREARRRCLPRLPGPGRRAQPLVRAQGHSPPRRRPTYISARWVVDASGRANPLRRKLGLQTEMGHTSTPPGSASPGGSTSRPSADNQEWIDRVYERGFRALATVHLLDQGYWVWMIPLSRGQLHRGLRRPALPPVRGDLRVRPDARLARAHEPQLADAVAPRRRRDRWTSWRSRTSPTAPAAFSNDRWTLVGEAGGFIDAFYSPGSDISATQHLHRGPDLARPRRRGHRGAHRVLELLLLPAFTRLSCCTRTSTRSSATRWVAGEEPGDNTAYFRPPRSCFLNGKMTDQDVLAESSTSSRR